MRIGALFKKHFVATILLILSILVAIHAGIELHKSKNTDKEEINHAITLEPSNQIAQSDAQTVAAKKSAAVSKIVAPNNPLTLSPPQSTGVPVDAVQGTVIVDGHSYHITFIAGNTVYDAMKKLHDSGTITVKFKNYSGLGYFVDGINGVESDTFRAKYWIYYINGAKAQVGISQYELNQNDIITWKYEAAE